MSITVCISLAFMLPLRAIVILLLFVCKCEWNVYMCVCVGGGGGARRPLIEVSFLSRVIFCLYMVISEYKAQMV